jgi:hypothetical protein
VQGKGAQPNAAGDKSAIKNHIDETNLNANAHHLESQTQPQNPFVPDHTAPPKLTLDESGSNL